MPSQVYEDVLPLPIGLLRAENPGPGDPAYPHPRLVPTGQEEMREFGSVVLENGLLRVTLVPALGGRIVSLVHIPSGKEVLERDAALRPVEGGRRGAWLPDGIQPTLDGGPRRNGLGRVDSLVLAPDEPEDPARVLLHELAVGDGFSWHLEVSLPPGRAEIAFEFRIHRREPGTARANPGLGLRLGRFAAHRWHHAWVLNAPDRDLALAVEGPLGGCRADGDVAWLTRFVEPVPFGERQWEAFTVRLAVFAGVGQVAAANAEAAMAVHDDRVAVAVTAPRDGHRLLLGIADGQTLEAPADLRADVPFVVPLEGIPAKPVVLALRTPDRQEVLRWTAEPPTTPTVPPAPPEPFALPQELEDHALEALAFAPAAKAAVARELAHRALAGGEPSQAADHLERSLLYHAEDPLVWWLKAVAHRLAGDDADERPELPNAHYLTPLEPVLRAESFLRQNVQTKEPSPLLRPLADFPDTLVEVAARLLEAGLISEASRFLDEALRHVDLPMLRLLQAYAFLKGSRMEAEAAEHVAAAAKLPEGPPYPWRRIEREALRWLAQRFGQPFLQNLQRLAEGSPEATRVQ